MTDLSHLQNQDCWYIQQGLVLWWFIPWRFTFTTPVQSDRALPTYRAPLSQFKRPFSTYCASSCFLVCMCFFFFRFSAVLLSWLWFPPMTCVKETEKKKKKTQNSWRYILSWCLLNHGLGLLQQNKKWFDWYFFQLSV